MLLASSRALSVVFYALIFLCYYAWSYSISHCVAFRPPGHVEFSRSTTARSLTKALDSIEIYGDDAIIRSVAVAATKEELDETLRKVFESSRTRSMISPTDEIEIIHLNDASIEETLNMFPSFSTEVLAAALRRLAVLSARDMRRETVDSLSPLLPSLIETIAQQMMASQREHGLLGVYALADILQALTLIVQADIYTDADESEIFMLDRFMETSVEMLTRHEITELKKLGPVRLLQCLQAMARLGIQESALHHRIYEQLLKPNASSRLPARYLAHGLDAVASVIENRAMNGENMGDENNEASNETTLLARSFMRRMRKQNVRNEATIDDLCRALLATHDLWHSGGLRELEDEAAIFGFTTLREILKKKREGNVSLAPRQMATMMVAWGTISTKQKEGGTVIEDLMAICENDEILAKASILELERILSSIKELETINHAGIMKTAGERLVALSLDGRISPTAFNSILRCPVLLHRKNQTVMDPYIEACQIAFTSESFLQKSSISEMANFLWFASISQWRHDESLWALGRRIMDPQLCETCSPKLASRILAAYTSIVAQPTTRPSHQLSRNDEVSDLTSKLFHNYGGHLLSNKLSAAEVSSSLYAYAKVLYFQDMGIFDHLLSLMASMTSSCDAPTARQLTQSLWSCGKMSVFDAQDEKVGAASNVEPNESSFARNAQTIARALSRRTEEMSPVDVTQCMWALGRLGSTDEEVLSSFADRAMGMVDELNAVEISNILWGLSKTRFGAGALVDRMATRLSSGSIDIAPKEVAMALFALGKMRVADEAVFNNLSTIMIKRIEETSAQGIANTLWAYRNVNLRPPPQLLNLWALQKLGLVSFEIKNE